MRTIALRQTTTASPERLFALATDLARLHTYIPQITHIDVLTPGPIGVGTRWRETRKAMGTSATVELRVVDFTPNTGFCVVCETAGCRYTSRFAFARDSASTQASMTTTVEPLTILGRVASILTTGAMKKGLAGDLAALVRHAENNPA